MLIPSSTYRIQLHEGFTFRHLEGILDYLQELGISTVYASPITTATKGSQHGYDVTDPLVINPEIGTESDLEKLAGLLKKKNMTWLQDIVPNHMAFENKNTWLYDALERGKISETYRFFDIDTEHSTELTGTKVMVPFLGKTLTECLQNKELKLAYKYDDPADPTANPTSNPTIASGAAPTRNLPVSAMTNPVPTAARPAVPASAPPTGNGFVISYYDNDYPVSVSAYQWICTIAEGCPPGLLVSLRQLEQSALLPVAEWTAAKRIWLQQTAANQEWMTFLRQLITFFNGQASLMGMLLDSQHYILTHFQLAASRINYRRFFTVNSLICLRMEDPNVFSIYHKKIREWVQKGYIQGLRIDHIDGLAAPRQYIRDLGRLMGNDFYIVAEKILAADESLPEDWPLQGTTGYEFLSMISQLLTDADGYRQLQVFYREKINKVPAYEEIVFARKYDFLKTQMGGEWNNLVDLLLSLPLLQAEQMDKARLKEALGIFMASFPVYRIYPELPSGKTPLPDKSFSPKGSSSPDSTSDREASSSPDSTSLPEKPSSPNNTSRAEASSFRENASPSEESSAPHSSTRADGVSDTAHSSFPEASRRFIDQAFSKAAAHYPAKGSAELNFLQALFQDSSNQEKTRFQKIFQSRLMQFTGPLAAKGIEDTTFYVYNPLISRNEVGDSPVIEGLTPAAFHEKMAHRQLHLPYSLNATATHDTKRGEDGRIRLNWLSSIPEEWIEKITKWKNINSRFIQEVPLPHSPAGTGPAPSANDEYFIYQSLIGSFPVDLRVTGPFRERCHQFLTKALREAKTNTNYDAPNEAYEKNCHAFLTAILEEGAAFLEDFIPFVDQVIGESMPYSLSQELVKLTAPGIPDIYQGAESWDLSLVDPDNRLPVDYTLRKSLLAKIKEAEDQGPAAALDLVMAHLHEGAGKLFTIYKTLNYRYRHPLVFTAGHYIPIQVPGPHLSYIRRYKDDWALVVIPLIRKERVREERVRKEKASPDILSIPLPAGAPAEWTHLFTGELFTGKQGSGNSTAGMGTLELNNNLSKFPVALFISRSS